MSDLNALDLEPGEIVGGYTLISRLGGGAMGSVWRVRDDGGQVYAMKILRDSLKDDSETGNSDFQNNDTSAEGDAGNYGDTSNSNGSVSYSTTNGNAAGNEYGGSDYGQNGNANTQHHHRSHDPHVTARERMRREAVAMRKIHHPGVCAIVDMELDDSLAFIVTELIEGKNLRDDVAANGRYVGDDLQRLASKLIDAVRAVHAQGIIHRDIKPTNVMVSAAGPVLVDFGIAMTAGESHVTRTGLVMGTPGFIAPEIIDGAESNEATDWWSLASVIAFAATGHPVFGSKPMMAVLEREASGNANLAGLPPNTLNALRSALNPDPTKRCSPDQLLQAITLDALNPFATGELEDDDAVDNTTAGFAAPNDNTNNANGYGSGMGSSNLPTNSNNGAEGVVPPFGQTPRPDSNSPNQQPNNPRTAWTNSTHLLSEPSQSDNTSSSKNSAIPPVASQGQQLHGSTRAMPLTSQQPVNSSTTVQSPRYSQNQPPQVQKQQPAASSPTASSKENATEALPTPSPQDLTATAAMSQIESNAAADPTATMPLGSAMPMTQTLEQTSPLPASNLQDAQQTEAGTMPIALAPVTQVQQPLGQPASYAGTPYIYGQPNGQQVYMPQPAPAQPMIQSMALNPEPVANPADIRRGKLLSRSILPLCLLTIPLALLSASVPLISICCASVLLWFLLTLGYSEEGQLEREGRRGGIRKGGDPALRTVSLPWHILKALIFAIPRTLLLIIIAGVGPVVVNLVSGLPTHMVALQIGTWHLPLPLPADFSLSYSSLSLAIFMAAAWLVTVFGPKTMLLRIGAGRLRGPAYPKSDNTVQAQLQPLAPARAESGYGDNSSNPENSIINSDDINEFDDETDMDGDTGARHHPSRRWILLVIWLVMVLATLALTLTNHQINWIPLPNPQM